MNVTIHTAQDKLPDFWDSSVIFFANLLSLFYGNQKETQVLMEEVGALASYGSRMVPLLNLLYRGSENFLLLENDPDPDLMKYFQEDLHLALPVIKTISHSEYLQITENDDECEVLRSHAASYIDGYVTDMVIQKLAKKIGKNIVTTRESSRRGNNKVFLHKFLEHQGFPIFETIMVESLNETIQGCQELKKRGFKQGVLKASIGASGIGMEKIDFSKEFRGVDEYLFYEGPCLLQGWLDENVTGVEFLGSPSVQMFIKDNDIYLYDLTEQILKNAIHQGNESPPEYIIEDNVLRKEIFCQAGAAAQWLHTQEYRGSGSIDFHVIKRKGKIEVRICEINARVTGATYPAILTRHFMPKGAWLMRNICFSPGHETSDLLEILSSQDILYRKEGKQGVLPFNFNPDADGKIVKGQFLFLGYTLEDVKKQVKRFMEIPHLKGYFDRD